LKTLLFCTSYLDGSEDSEKRINKWLEYYKEKMSLLGDEVDIAIVDDGGELIRREMKKQRLILNKITFKPIKKVLTKEKIEEIRKELGKSSPIISVVGHDELFRHFIDIPINHYTTKFEEDRMQLVAVSINREINDKIFICHFRNNYGRPFQTLYPGWWRSFAFGAWLARQYKYDKLIFIESDAFLLTPKAFQTIRNVKEGWWSVWCKSYNSMESAIQVICKDKFELYESYWRFGPHFWWKHCPNYARELNPNEYCPEFTLQAHVNGYLDLKGDRYGEDRFPTDSIPRDVDYFCQAGDVSLHKLMHRNEHEKFVLLDDMIEDNKKLFELHHIPQLTKEGIEKINLKKSEPFEFKKNILVEKNIKEIDKSEDIENHEEFTEEEYNEMFLQDKEDWERRKKEFETIVGGEEKKPEAVFEYNEEDRVELDLSELINDVAEMLHDYYCDEMKGLFSQQGGYSLPDGTFAIFKMNYNSIQKLISQKYSEITDKERIEQYKENARYCLKPFIEKYIERK